MSGIVPLLESSNSCFSLRLTLLALDLFSDPLMVINFIDLSLRIFFCLQHKAVLMRQLPDGLKLNIAQRIENNLFSKVGLRTVISGQSSSVFLSHYIYLKEAARRYRVV